jgi:hypothetical protein
MSLVPKVSQPTADWPLGISLDDYIFRTVERIHQSRIQRNRHVLHIEEVNGSNDSCRSLAPRATFRQRGATLLSALLATHSLLVVASVSLSEAFGDNAGTTIGDWLVLVVLYLLLFALPTTLVTVFVCMVSRQMIVSWRQEHIGPGVTGLVVSPLVAAASIAITNDGAQNGWIYLAGCAALAGLSVATFLRMSRQSRTPCPTDRRNGHAITGEV